MGIAWLSLTYFTYLHRTLEYKKMQETELAEIIRKLQTTRQEWKTVDAKQEMSHEYGAKVEFVKDMIAMANNAEPSFLVIGLKDGAFTPVGTLNYHHNKNDLNNFLIDKIDPLITVGYQEFTIDENQYAVVEVHGKNPPYIIAQDLENKQDDRRKIKLQKGTIYVRHEDRTEGISRFELEKYFKVGLRKAFEDETEYALQLALNKPDNWTHLLTAELLQSKLALVRRSFDELQRGLIYKRATRMSGKEFLDWNSLSCNDLLSLIEMLTIAVTEEMPASWKGDGACADPLEIKRAVDKVISACNGFLELEIELRFILPPEVFLQLKQLLTGWTLEYLNQLDKIPANIFKIFSQSDLNDKYTIKIVLDEPASLQQAMAELKRLTNNPQLWINT